MSAAPPAEAAAERLPAAGFRTSAATRVREIGFRALLLAALGLVLLVLMVLLTDVVVDGAGQLSLNFLTDTPSRIDPASSGIGPALVGTLWLMMVCAAFVIPVGVAAAVYLEEYADGERWFNRLIEVNIQNLAAVESIIFGILGLAYLVRGPLSLGNVVVAGGLTLGLVVLPVLIVAAREAIRAVPPSIREGSLALGATKLQTIRKQVLPAAIPGIATGSILALSRAIGETAPLILVGASAFRTTSDTGLFTEFSAMPIQIFGWTSEAQEEYKLLAASAIIVLLVALLGMNSIAIWLRNKYETKW